MAATVNIYVLVAYIKYVKYFCSLTIHTAVLPYLISHVTQSMFCPSFRKRITTRTEHNTG
jgi:hypothetical protein